MMNQEAAMTSVSESTTLLADWRMRRDRLNSADCAPAQFRETQLRVLEYLIGRYTDSPDALRPARFPAIAQFHSNDRAIVVHHHLGQGRVGGVNTEAEAERRVNGIFARMADTTDAGPQTSESDQWIETVSTCRGERISNRAWARLVRALRNLGKVEKVDMRAVRLFAASHDCNVASLAVRAWRKRVAAACDDQATTLLRTYLTRPTHREAALEPLRGLLADDNPEVRLEACKLIGEIGTLDDVSLLSDLLSLPTSDDESPQERRALADAMHEISRRGDLEVNGE
jgi:hypothetical protein